MPVTTRSRARSGLQHHNTVAPPSPPSCPTCSNAILTTTTTTDVDTTSFNNISLPELCDQSPSTGSSLEADTCSSSSLDRGFEISKFQNLEIPIPSILSVPSTLNLAQNFQMESDCVDNKTATKRDPGASNDDILQILTAISTQMISGQQDLQAEIQKVRDENEHFKASIRAELLANTQVHQNTVPYAPTTPNSSAMPLPSAMLSSSVDNTIPPSTSSDFQNQMLVLLNDTFSKLTSVINDTTSIKTSDTKSEWVKFSGDPKKFRSWYLAVMAQLSIAPWQDLYDSTTNSVVKSTTNAGLNSKLYAKVIGSLEGSALQHMLARKHLRANGILLLQELHQMYKPKCVPEVLAAKTAEFWGHTKRSSSESVDDYYNRFHELLEELNETVETIPIKTAIRHFIFTLGTEFEPLQMNFRLGTLAPEWHTEDWPSLLVLCRDFYNSVNPKGPSTYIKRDRDPFSELQIDRSSHHKKIRNWFMNPTKFKIELDSEQRKYPGRCIYHLSKTHGTADCHVKKECDKLLSAKKSSSPTNGSSTAQMSGQLRHMTEDLFEDAVELEESKDESIDIVDNDTNDSDLLYFARVSNHYLRLVKHDPTKAMLPDNILANPIIVDSGANFHMFKNKEFFTSLLPATGKVILGDGTTCLPILGVGTVQCRIGTQNHIIENVRYVPMLSESVYSLFVHIQQPDHGVYSSFDKGLYLKFPNFHTQAIIGANDIYLDASPLCASMDSMASNTGDKPTQFVCHRISEFQENIRCEMDHLDNLLHSLKEYYDSIKTKRQLQLEVPAGFRKDSLHRKVYLAALTDHRLSADIIDSSTDLDSDFMKCSVPTCNPSTGDITCDTINTNSSHDHVPIPIIRSVDKPASSIPHTLTVSEDFLRASLGFRRIDTLKRHLNDLYCPTLRLDSTPPDAVLDSGDFATLRKTARNTTPVPRSSHFGQVMHMDIVFGPEVAVGNIHYGLLFTDRYSRMSYVYPLQNLTSDIPKQLEAFFAHLGFVPDRLISDFDMKLIGGKAREYLNSLLIHVNAAPAFRQDKNGLAERHWQTMVAMARNWLASAELPSSFWYYAVRRAAEVCNYFPYKLEDGNYTTPFELVYKQKPDLRVLFRMFGLAAVRRERIGKKNVK
jgi:hypothetical protein